MAEKIEIAGMPQLRELPPGCQWRAGGNPDDFQIMIIRDGSPIFETPAISLSQEAINDGVSRAWKDFGWLK